MFNNLSYMQYQLIVLITALLIVGLIVLGAWALIRWVMEEKPKQVLYCQPKDSWLERLEQDSQKTKQDTPIETLRQTNPVETDRILTDILGHTETFAEMRKEQPMSIHQICWHKGMRDFRGRFISKDSFDRLSIMEQAHLWDKHHLACEK